MNWNRDVQSNMTGADSKRTSNMPVIGVLRPSCFQALSLNPKISIANILLGHQRPHYVGEHQMEGEKLDIIDLISTMTLGHILRARSSGSELSPPGLLISIKRHLRTIMGKMPKYKNVLIPILEIDPG